MLHLHIGVRALRRFSGYGGNRVQANTLELACHALKGEVRLDMAARRLRQAQAKASVIEQLQNRLGE